MVLSLCKQVFWTGTQTETVPVVYLLDPRTLALAFMFSLTLETQSDESSVRWTKGVEVFVLTEAWRTGLLVPEKCCSLHSTGINIWVRLCDSWWTKFRYESKLAGTTLISIFPQMEAAFHGTPAEEKMSRVSRQVETPRDISATHQVFSDKLPLSPWFSCPRFQVAPLESDVTVVSTVTSFRGNEWDTQNEHRFSEAVTGPCQLGGPIAALRSVIHSFFWNVAVCSLDGAIITRAGRCSVGQKTLVVISLICSSQLVQRTKKREPLQRTWKNKRRRLEQTFLRIMKFVFLELVP